MELLLVAVSIVAAVLLVLLVRASQTLSVVNVELESEREQRGQAASAAHEARVKLEAELATERKLREQEAAAGKEKVDLLRGDREALQQNLKAVASEVLSGTTDQLVKLAGEQRKADKEAATSELGKRTTEVKTAVAPVAEQLQKLQQQVEHLQRERKSTEATIKQLFAQTASGLEKLKTETGALVDALKRPQVRGAWGEMQLRNVVRMAGMTDHVDFHEQESMSVGDEKGGTVRPDMVVHLPTGRDIVVDSKVPLDAYLAALESQNDDDRSAHLDRHARQLRKHLDQLSSKDYYAKLDRSAEFVVCFVPNEACYVAALDRDASLIEHGADKRVLLATPTTLLALLHATHYGWRQAAVEESAQKIADEAVELHKRIGVFAGHYARVGRHLNSATAAFNDSVASYESRLVPQLRRFDDLKMASKNNVEAPSQVDLVPRALEVAAEPEPDEASA